jgi:hypothetical protein
VRAHTRQIKSEHAAAERHDEFAGEHATLNSQMTELHHCRAALGMERAATIDCTKA